MNLKEIQLNFLQTLAVTGFVVSGVSQIGLMLLNKTVANFWYVYPVWAVVFVLGIGLRYLPQTPHDHHHHDHDH